MIILTQAGLIFSNEVKIKMRVAIAPIAIYLLRLPFGTNFAMPTFLKRETCRFQFFFAHLVFFQI